jgi:nitrite reductase (NADH) small subunit/3-phenylpropionate/trans-cinnamate dioxygenase ferredoxin subunit
MSDYHRIGSIDDFREGRGIAVDVAGERVAVFKVDGKIHAMDDKCPHMGASLADGRILDGRVECHMHEWTFDIVTGEGSRKDKPWACARIFDVRIEGREVLVRPPAPPEPTPEEDDWVPWDDSFLKKNED